MLRDAVLSAAGRPEVRAAVARVYADLQDEIHRRKPRCDASGRCCRFEEFGHRLYVTTIELAAFAGPLLASGEPSQPGGRGRPPEDPGEPTPLGGSVPRAGDTPLGTTEGMRTDPGGCPFQVGGLCSVHSIRPFGCRVFFCDSTSDEWQHAQYERFHATLKRLHEEFDLPYRYVEWREALRALDLPGPAGRPAAGDETPADGGGRRLSLPQLPL